MAYTERVKNLQRILALIMSSAALVIAGYLYWEHSVAMYAIGPLASEPLRLGELTRVQVLTKLADDPSPDLGGDLSLAGSGIIGVDPARFLGFTSTSAAATTTEFPANNDWGIHRNTTADQVSVAYNVSSTITDYTIGGQGQYAGIFREVDFAQVIGSSPEKVTVFNSDSPESGADGDNATAQITINADGDYMVCFSTSLQSSNDKNAIFYISIDGGSTTSREIQNQNIPGDGVAHSVSAAIILALTDGDIVALMMELDTSQNLTFSNIDLNVNRIGE